MIIRVKLELRQRNIAIITSGECITFEGVWINSYLTKFYADCYDPNHIILVEIIVQTHINLQPNLKITAFLSVNKKNTRSNLGISTFLLLDHN